MPQVARLTMQETAQLDCGRLQHLVDELGAKEADRYVARTLEDIAVRLNRLVRAWRRGDTADLCTRAQDLSGIAASVGLATLATVAADVALTALRGDVAATGATVARLERIGDASLQSIWEFQDPMI